jgi:hypothetical protein
MTKMSSWQAKAPVMAVVSRVALMFQKINVLLVVMSFQCFCSSGGRTTQNKRLTGRNAEVRISRRWLTVIAAAGGLLIVSSPVTTAQAAVGDSGQICLTNAPSYCIHSNGPGQQVTITNVDAQKSNFTVVYDSNGYHGWQNGNGNCLREGTNGVVKIENGPCNTSDATDFWGHGVGSTTWYNDFYKDNIMYTNGHVTGDKVWAGTVSSLPSGSYSKWNAPT